MRQPAGDSIAEEFGAALTTTLGGVLAARVVGAACGYGVELGHGARDLVKHFIEHTWVDRGRGRHEPLGVRVLRLGEYGTGGADFHKAAGVEYGDAVGDFGYDAHVVSDEQYRRAAAAAQALQELKDLRLHRDVERGGGFVGDYELGVGYYGEGDDDALAHAAGEHMRVGVKSVRVDADFGEGAVRELDGLSSAQRQVREYGLDELAADATQRIQAGERVLEDHANAFAAQARGGVVDALTVQVNGASGDATRRVYEADDRRAGHGFASARFAHQAEYFTFVDAKR